MLVYFTLFTSSIAGIIHAFQRLAVMLSDAHFHAVHFGFLRLTFHVLLVKIFWRWHLSVKWIENSHSFYLECMWSYFPVIGRSPGAIGLRALIDFFEWLKQCETDDIDKHLLGVRATEKASDSFGPWDGVCLKEVVGVTSPVAQLFTLILTRSICCHSWQRSVFL